MEAPEFIDIASAALWQILKIGSPVLLVALAVGLGIALFQALTQIQEITLTFVPKIFAIFLSLILFLPFMTYSLINFAQEIFALIAAPS